MIFDIEVKVSLKEGMLNPEATTIERSLALLGYDVKNARRRQGSYKGRRCRHVWKITL